MIDDNAPSAAPYQIIGSYAGKPLILRSSANRVILSYNGTNKSFPNRESALFYTQTFCQRKEKEVIKNNDNAVKR